MVKRHSNGPVLVRVDPRDEEVTAEVPSASRPWMRVVRLVLLLAGICGVGIYGYSTANQYVYQRYENWAFDQQISGHAPVTFLDFVREQTPLGAVIGSTAVPSAPVRNPASSVEPEHQIAAPAHGSLIGRLEIPRLNLSAMVREGVDGNTLSKAVGHVPSTALPGQVGNFAIAAHRDTLFRALKDIQQGDQVTFQTPDENYTYRIISMRIVRPSEVAVLRPDGGLRPAAAHLQEVSDRTPNAPDPRKVITMITCYPFYYVGSAPKRFIVQGELVSTSSVFPAGTQEARNLGPPKKLVKKRSKPRPSHQARVAEPRTNRGSSRIRADDASTRPAAATKRKHGLWHRLFHISTGPEAVRLVILDL